MKSITLHTYGCFKACLMTVPLLLPPTPPPPSHLPPPPPPSNLMSSMAPFGGLFFSQWYFYFLFQGEYIDVTIGAALGISTMAGWLQSFTFYFFVLLGPFHDLM